MGSIHQLHCLRRNSTVTKQAPGNSWKLFLIAVKCVASMSFSDRKIIKNVIIHKGPAQIFPTNEVMNFLHYYLKTKGKSFLVERHIRKWWRHEHIQKWCKLNKGLRGHHRFEKHLKSFHYFGCTFIYPLLRE